MDVDGYSLNRLIGIHGGRGWHLRGAGWIKGTSGLLRPATLCGKAGDKEWRPGPNNRPTVCGACRKADAVPDPPASSRRNP